MFDAVIDHFGLDVDAKAGTLSRGERAGLCLAMTLAPEPELLVLDDPALGLDPVARRALVEAMLAVTSRKDRTILLKFALSRRRGTGGRSSGDTRSRRAARSLSRR